MHVLTIWSLLDVVAFGVDPNGGRDDKNRDACRDGEAGSAAAFAEDCSVMGCHWVRSLGLLGLSHGLRLVSGRTRAVGCLSSMPAGWRHLGGILRMSRCSEIVFECR